MSSSSSEEESGQYSNLLAALDDSGLEEEEDGVAEAEEDDVMEESSSSSEEEEEEEEEEKEPSPPPKRKRKRKESTPKPKALKASKASKVSKKPRAKVASVVAAPALSLPLVVAGKGRFFRLKQRNPPAAVRTDEDQPPINQRAHRHGVLRTQEGILSSMAQTERWLKEALQSVFESPLVKVMYQKPPKEGRRWCLSNNAKTFALMKGEHFLSTTAASAHQIRSFRARTSSKKKNSKKRVHQVMLYKSDVDNAVRLAREFRDSCSRVFI